jgi:hypothetical protein
MSINHPPDYGGLGIDLDTKRRIVAYARAVGSTPADVVRKAFEEYEATHKGTRAPGQETAFDALSRAGLIGCLNDAPETPADLATNPEHMEGFGRE